MKSEKPNPIRRMVRIVVILAAILAAGFILRSCSITRLILRIPSYETFSGPIKNGNNGLGMYGAYGRTIDFSPDAQTLAYIWQDASYVYSPKYEGRPCTLTESLEIRVRSISGTNEELRVPLDSVDLRPEGVIYFSLEVGLQAGPDSRHVAAVCARRLVLIDLNTRTHREIEYPGESFGGFSWLSTNTLAFSTLDGKSQIFWRGEIDSLPSSRVKVYAVDLPNQNQRGISQGLRDDQWSPNGRFVSFVSYFANSDRRDNALLDLQTGAVHTFPCELYDQCWKPDCTTVLVHDRIGEGHRTLLIDPVGGKALNLTKDFEKEFGPNMNLTFVAPVWTPDGKYVVLYNTSEPSSARHRGCLVQPRPFKVVLSRNQILRWSPIPGWVLLQGDMAFKWIDYAGSRTAPIHGWPNEWTWSEDGSLAANISKGKVEVFKPELPPRTAGGQ